MSFDSDVALIGTGLAPLIAASHLLAQGKSVLLLNPDFDFFLENSELPLDPLLPVGRETLKPERIASSLPDSSLNELRPFFPGPLEFWSDGVDPSGYHDPQAPHVRSRSRLWISSDGLLEDLYVQASDEGWHPQILEGIHASSRFPGMAQPRDMDRGLLLPKLCDVDVSRYRNGVLEFVRERLGRDRVINQASQMELMPGGIRFHWEGSPRTARLNEGMLIFWTPRMTSWILGQAKRYEAKPVLPKGVRLWEQWELVSRDPLDTTVVGIFGSDLAVWAETEGPPRDQKLHKLSVLRAGELLRLDATGFLGGVSWASQNSFVSLSSLCHGFLKWDRFSVRSMSPRAILEWGNPVLWPLADSKESDRRTQVVTGCDGPIAHVVKNARLACEKVFGASP